MRTSASSRHALFTSLAKDYRPIIDALETPEGNRLIQLLGTRCEEMFYALSNTQDVEKIKEINIRLNEVRFFIGWILTKKEKYESGMKELFEKEEKK